MIVELFANPVTWWLFGTAVVFTFVGRFMSFRDHVTLAAEKTIDQLIKEGYLKTRGVGRNQEILKHTEWCKKDVDIL
jgi:hypothetical protein